MADKFPIGVKIAYPASSDWIFCPVAYGKPWGRPMADLCDLEATSTQPLLISALLADGKQPPKQNILLCRMALSMLKMIFLTSSKIFFALAEKLKNKCSVILWLSLRFVLSRRPWNMFIYRRQSDCIYHHLVKLFRRL